MRAPCVPKLESRFEILPIASGVLLTPRFRTSVKSIELSNSTFAIDGTPVTGPELRERLGNDADVVLQLSYLDADALRALARGEASPPKPVDPWSYARSSLVDRRTRAAFRAAAEAAWGDHARRQQRHAGCR